MISAVIDRFEEERAVLLVGDEEKELVLPSTALPNGLQEGDYVRLEISYDAEKTEAAREEAAALLRELQGE